MQLRESARVVSEYGVTNRPRQSFGTPGCRDFGPLDMLCKRLRPPNPEHHFSPALSPTSWRRGRRNALGFSSAYQNFDGFLQGTLDIGSPLSLQPSPFHFHVIVALPWSRAFA